MRMTVILMALFGMVQVLLNHPPARTDKHEVQVFYYPMYDLSLMAMDRETIMLQYDLTSLMRRDVDKLIRRLSDGEPIADGFKNGYLRVLIVQPDKSMIECDIYGNVRIAKKQFHLTREQYKAIHKLIRDSLPPR